MDTLDPVDAVVIGAGFGGLAAALTLAEGGHSVRLFEALKYPGGCASTFEKGGARYETGATLFSGLGPRGLFGRWKETHDLDVEFHFPDPPVELRTPSLTLPVSTDRAAFIDRLCALPDAPEPGIRAFFREQGQVADALWPVLERSGRLPPFADGGLTWHLGRAHRYLPLLRQVGRPALAALERHGLADWRPLRTWVDALCQITVQASAADAEAPFALSTLDYCFRGTGQVRGGVGALARAMVGAIERAGGRVEMPARVRALEPDGDAWRVTARGQQVRARHVVGNLLPQALAGMMAHPPVGLARLQQPVDAGWSACMLYLRVRPDPALRPEPHHLELVADEDAPFTDGNHVFVSLTGVDEARARDGERTVTVSTHVRPTAPGDDPAAAAAAVHARMQATLEALAPEVVAATTHRMTASPRTWQRFTGRPGGLVGGAPRTVGLHHYTRLGPVALAPGLWLVGDSVFPGQSTLATALGGAATARAVMRAP